jgi:poly-beta-1,6-N-acetyl-D-glucosamine biosynthesis protein PgaD
MNANPPPPIIAFARASTWIRIRDIVLTTAAWTRLLYLMRDGLKLIVDYFSYPIFELSHAHSADWMEVWNRMSPFLVLSVLGMLWLILWGLIHRRRLQFAAAHATPPAALALEPHAAFFHLEAAAVERSHEAKVAVVQFDEQHRIVSFTTK